MNNDGVELFQIGNDKTGFSTYDTVYIKDNNRVVVSSGPEGNRCITIKRSTQKALIQQLLRQTFECWWLLSSDRCLS
jgi:hypothetical protein